jgi:hypothetical protein
MSSMHWKPGAQKRSFSKVVLVAKVRLVIKPVIKLVIVVELVIKPVIELVVELVAELVMKFVVKLVIKLFLRLGRERFEAIKVSCSRGTGCSRGSTTSSGGCGRTSSSRSAVKEFTVTEMAIAVCRPYDSEKNHQSGKELGSRHGRQNRAEFTDCFVYASDRMAADACLANNCRFSLKTKYDSFIYTTTFLETALYRLAGNRPLRLLLRCVINILPWISASKMSHQCSFP